MKLRELTKTTQISIDILEVYDGEKLIQVQTCCGGMNAYLDYEVETIKPYLEAKVSNFDDNRASVEAKLKVRVYKA